MDLNQLNTEQVNPASFTIEEMDIPQITSYINKEDQGVPLAVQKVLPAINSLIEAVVEQLKKGGRLIYIGAGTSGRLGILDASECPPTYGVSSDLVQGLIAGGEAAIRFAQEGAEDNEAAAREDLKAIHLSNEDFLIGIAASGKTPYVKAALNYANELHAKTGAVSCVAHAELSTIVTYPVEVLVGPEVITGSSRMKAGTAQKLILNMISTTTMIRLGKIYKGYMVDVKPTNSKLVERAQNIIQETTGVSSDEAKETFTKTRGDVKLAILTLLGNCRIEEAQSILNQYQQNIAQAIKALLLKKGEHNESRTNCK